MRTLSLLALCLIFFTSCDVKPVAPPPKAEIKYINIKSYNNKFVSADATMSMALIADRDEAKEWEKFTAYYLDSITIVLRSTYNTKYISTDGNKENELIANRVEAGELERFTIIKLDSGRVAFKSFGKGYVSADQTRNSHLVANRKEIGQWEKFRIIEVKESK